MSILKGKKIGFAICASCCTYQKIVDYIKELKECGAEVIPIMSENAQVFDTRFALAKDYIKKIEDVCGRKILKTIPEVEPIGPKGLLDILVIAPCTGNTLAKLANAITDTTVTMSAKAMLRNEKPVIISLTTNDALGLNMKNIGELLNVKHIYFVPLCQDNYNKKPNSLSARLDLLIPTIEHALEEKQIQPVIVEFQK